MRSRTGLAVMGGSALALLAASAALGGHPVVFWNASASLPRGLYVAERSTSIAVGDVVAAWLPEHVRAIAAERRYLPLQIPMIKTVRATAGATVCAATTGVSVDGRKVAERLTTDSHARALPSWEGCKTLAQDEVFLLSDHAPSSFDGRYFGAISTRQIVAKVRPIWTY